jgi:hypothetical protein
VSLRHFVFAQNYSEEEFQLKNSIRIYNRWLGYSIQDCSCAYCRWYLGKKRGCALPECCCSEERAEAERRERNAGGVAPTQKEAA